MQEQLSKLGLSPVEIKVYQILNREGSLLAGRLAKLSESNRSNCYDALKRLIEKGLVSYVMKKNKKYFQSTGSESILNLVNTKRAQMENDIQIQENLAKQVIRELKAKNPKCQRQRTEIYETSRGIIKLLDDMIKEKKEILILGVGGDISEILDYYLPRFHNQRIKEKISLKIILEESLRETRGKKLNNMKYTKVRFLPKQYGSINTTNIYGDKIAIMIWSANPTGILVENKEVADAHKKQFNLVWQTAKN